jgi:hypothetical protein
MQSLPARIIQVFSIQNTMNPTPWLKYPSIGIPKARLVSEYASAMRVYVHRPTTYRNRRMERKFREEPVTTMLSRRIAKPE